MSTIMVRSANRDSLAQALDDIFREHHRFIYRTAYSVTGSWQDAEDVVQTIFLRLLQRESPLEFRTSPKAYLYRAAVNLSLNTVQSRKHRNLSDDVECVEAASSPDSNGDDDVQRILLDAIAQLKPRTVEILILHYEHSYSDAEIARMLGKSRGTIAVTLYRARARLRKLMLRATSGGKQ